MEKIKYKIISINNSTTLLLNLRAFRIKLYCGRITMKNFNTHSLSIISIRNKC